MQTTIRTSLLLLMLASVVVLLATATAHAQDPGLPFDPQNPGYLGNPPLGDPVVRDSSGDCVRTTSFDKERDGLIDCGDREPPVAAPPPAPAPVAVQESVTFDATTLFDFDSATLRPDGKAALADLQSQLASYPTVRSVTVTGHTDSTGPEEYNQGLSERRAQAVADHLASEKGVSRNLMTVVGKGETDPIASNSTREGRQQNRRVEVVVNAERQVFK